MATLEEIAAATKLLSEDSVNLMGAAGSKPEEIGVGAFDVNKNDAGSPDVVVVSEQVVETKTTEETTFDSISMLESELGDNGEDKIGVENFSGVNNAGMSISFNGVDEKIKDGANNGEGYFLDFEQLNGTKTEGFYPDVNGEKLEDQDSSFHVGDFVWGKIKSHPWWPGQVYDPKDASEYAVRHKQEGRLLVVFFGDGSCSWCLPSQLVPFVTNFNEMCKDSSSRSFRNAVQKAVDEIGRVLESDMICSCIPEEKKYGVGRPVVANAGLKSGVLMPKVDVRKLSIPKYEAAELVSKVRHLAKGVLVGSVLELAVLRSWFSALYRFKGGCELPVYHEPLYIEGMEDKNVDLTEVATNGSSVSIEVPTFGPMDEECLSAKSRGMSDDKVFRKRKQKSVNELMGERSSVKPESRKSLKRNKNEDGESSAEKTGKPEEIEVPDTEMTPGEAKEESEMVYSPRERKRSKYLSPPYTNLGWWAGNSRSKIVESESESDEKLLEPSVDNTSSEKVNDKKKVTFSISDVDYPVDELLSEIQSAALDPFYLRKKGSLDMVWDFISAFRSSTYLHGPDYTMHRKCKTEGKRKSLSKLGDGLSRKKAKSPDEQKKTPESGNKIEEKSFLPCLTLSFTPKFPLPSKEDIVRMFGKFGSLDEKKTKVVKDSHSVEIVYEKDSDAEKAFSSSLSECPFGVGNVSYKLQRPTRSSKSRPKFSSSLNQTREDDLILDVDVIKEKVGVMAAILEDCHSKFSTEEKASVKDEMKHLLKKVETTCEKVRAIAEKRSS